MNAKKSAILLYIVLTFCAAFAFSASAQQTPDLDEIFEDAKKRKGKNPAILIPGILGSELVNERTGEKVWFSLSRSKDDDLRLPITPSLRQSRDNLLPGDVIRRIDLTLFPDIRVYQDLIDSLQKYGGYEETTWEDPAKDLKDKLLVFPYDWRRDNVENARLLIEKIELLRRKTKQREIKFDVLAHSMGGLIARYAAMYGKEGLPYGRKPPSWIGEKYFNKIFLFGTPNEGTLGAFETMLEGKSSLGIATDLPFVRNLSPLDIATMPAVLQLLPHHGTANFYNEDMKKIDLNIYNVETWKKFGWGVFGNPERHLKGFSAAEIGRFEQYFANALNYARRFHEAMDSPSENRPSLGIYIVGGDCAETLDGIIVYQKGDKWITLTKPVDYRNTNGRKFSKEELRKIMYAPGDKRVTRRSLLAETLPENTRKSILFDTTVSRTSTLFVCEDHDKLTANLNVQSNIITVLVSEADK